MEVNLQKTCLSVLPTCSGEHSGKKKTLPVVGKSYLGEWASRLQTYSASQLPGELGSQACL